MRALPFLLASWMFFAFLGCNTNVPFDPASLVRPLDDALDQVRTAVEGAVADPLDSDPFPVLIGGDTQHVFYATNLGDIRLNFPGPTSDVVIPGFIGPSNLYEYRRNVRERSLLRPLILAGAFTGLATDGRFIAYVAIAQDEGGSWQAQRVVAADTSQVFDDKIVFEPASGPGQLLVPLQLAVNDGRVAFVVRDTDAVERLRIEDLLGLDDAREIETGAFGFYRLRGSRLVFVEATLDGVIRVVLRDLALDQETVVAPDVRAADVTQVRLHLTDNSVVWSEPTSDGFSRVMAYSIPAGEVQVWSDAIAGALAGATDDRFVTEEIVLRYPDAANQVVIRRQDPDGRVHEVARFRADGLAGQTRVLGDRLVWVNDDRRIVMMPVAGGDRTIIRPF